MSDVELDPSKYDKELDYLTIIYDPSEEDQEPRQFDQYGEYWNCTVATHCILCCEEELYDACVFFDFEDQEDDLLGTAHPEIVSDVYDVRSLEISKVTPNFNLLRPLFGGASADTIKCMSQLSMPIVKFLTPSSNTGIPTCNLKRYNEPRDAMSQLQLTLVSVMPLWFIGVSWLHNFLWNVNLLYLMSMASRQIRNLSTPGRQHQGIGSNEQVD
jgi:hypothetical protein